MKIILAEVFVLVALSCCRNDFIAAPLVLNQPIELRYKAVIKNTDFNISILLDSVLTDSRCPIGMECIWAGNASVRFIFSSSNITKPFILNTLTSFRTDTLIEGYRIKLIDLIPYPQAELVIQQVDYKAEIEITTP